MKTLQGTTVRDDVHWFTNPEKAFGFGEVMADNGFTAEYQNHGNCIAVVLSHIEPMEVTHA